MVMTGRLNALKRLTHMGSHAGRSTFIFQIKLERTVGERLYRSTYNLCDLATSSTE